VEIQNKVDRLVGVGKAVKIQNSITLVPMGKMLGVWVFDSPSIKLPRVFGTADLWNLDGWIKVRAVGSKRGTQRSSFDSLRATGIRKLEREFAPHIKSLALSTGLEEGLLTLLFLMTGTKMFAAYQEHPARFVQNFKGLSYNNFRLLLAGPFRYRWDLVIACYKMPWKHAIKRIWPSLNAQAANGLTWNDIEGMAKVKPLRKAIRWGQEAGSLQAHKTWYSTQKMIGGLTKIQWLNYWRRFGEEGSITLTNYFREIRRAKQDSLELPVWPNGIPEPAEAERRHEEITRLFQLKAEQGSAEIVQQHKKNWSPYELPEGWRPLITLGDFTQEGEAMHHCVGGYFRETSRLYAHLEHEGQQATVEWAADVFGDVWGYTEHPKYKWSIRQLYGLCNQAVSDDFKNWTAGCLQKMVEVAAAKTP